MNRLWFLLLGATGAVSCSQAGATVLLQTDFNSATVGAYANGSTINSGAAPSSQLAVNINTAGLTAQIADLGSGNSALQFIDNTATAGTLQTQKSISAVSTGATGENQFSIAYDVTPLAVAAGTRGTSLFAMTGTAVGAGSHPQVLSVQVNNSGTVTYFNGTTATSTTSTLTNGTTYHVAVSANLSSSTQDTYSLTITNASNGNVFLSAPSLNTRGFDTLPNLLYFSGGTNAGAASASPFIQYDNVSISSAAIPEPAALTLTAGIAAAALLPRRRMRRP